MQKLIEGEIARHRTCPDHGRSANIELPNATSYGRLRINEETHPCLKRERLFLEAIRRRRIGQMQIQGQEQMKSIEAIGEAPGEEKSNYTMER